MTTKPENRLTRRQFLAATAAGAAGVGMASLAGGTPEARASADRPQSGKSQGAGSHNILFILTDQERYFAPRDYPPGYDLPGRDRLQRRGLTFTNHQINTSVCTSSRSVIYTGQHIQKTRMFDNLDFPWIDSMRHDIPTLGNMLDEAGYYPAYLGKWHLSSELGTQDEYALPQRELTAVLERYGFNDYVGIGDVIGHTHGGFLNDDLIGALSRRWLRLVGKPLNREGQPWFLAVNLVNPHDVMFYNTDVPNQHIQDSPRPLMAIAREPAAKRYQQQWGLRLPPTRHEPFDKPGRPRAHWEYQQARGALVGTFPNEDDRWHRLLNYYFNCIQDADQNVEGLLTELDALGFADNTIVVLTSDHGELAGAHGTHGKGATAYKEQIHVPLIIAHPDYRHTHGQRCPALTAHLDLAPTILAWTGITAKQREKITRDLNGHDLTPLLDQGAGAAQYAVRNAALYSFNMFAYLDSAFMLKIQAYLNDGGDKAGLRKKGIRPDFTKRGAIRSVFDGYYRFTRYFSPKEHNQPRTLDGIFKLNDVELFDLKADPDESINLATAPEKHADLLLAMNAKMNALIETEIQEPDDGNFLPGKDADWAATRFDP